MRNGRTGGKSRQEIKNFFQTPKEKPPANLPEAMQAADNNDLSCPQADRLKQRQHDIGRHIGHAAEAAAAPGGIGCR